MHETMIDDKDIKKLLFVSLKNPNTLKDDIFFAVFDKNGDYIELQLQTTDGSGKIISPKTLTNKKTLKKLLDLTEENFMSIKEACNRKYLSTCKDPLDFYEKCHCLVNKDDEKNKLVCDESICIKPIKRVIINKIYEPSINKSKIVRR